MLLSDNETSIDFLNNDSIADAIIKTMEDTGDEPLSIGVYGDWGAGKSSVLKMIEEKLDAKKQKDNVICIRFDGWKHQGFEDAKIAIMSSIVSELNANEKIFSKAGDIIKKLWKSINWFSVAKLAGGAALSFASGGLAPLAWGAAQAAQIKNKIDANGTGVIDSGIDTIQEVLTNCDIKSDDSSTNMEFREFQKNFEELLDKTKIKRLIVMIDDLDRCLPEVAIETLEAVRLFMFVKKTVFIIAADEKMVKYAVTKHFENYPKNDNNNSGTQESYSDRYLEKLIQVPFRIPVLGTFESRLYIMQLLLGKSLGVQSEEFKKVLETAKTQLKEPWCAKDISVEELRSLLGDEKYRSCEDIIKLGLQVGSILATKSSGNPRKIKRFLNMLLLRKQIADSRGYGDSIKLDILAKIMLLEYFWPESYRKLATKLQPDGTYKEFELKKSEEEIIFNTDELKKWIDASPSLADANLFPYYFLCKEEDDLIKNEIIPRHLEDLIRKLQGKKIAVVNQKENIEKLTIEEQDVIFNGLTTFIVKENKYDGEPAGIEGLREFVKIHKSYQKKFADFLYNNIPKDVGLWFQKGWDGVFAKDSEADKCFKEFLKKNSDKSKISKLINENKGRK